MTGTEPESRTKRCRRCGKVFQNTDSGSCEECGAELAHWSELSPEDHQRLNAGYNTLEVI